MNMFVNVTSEAFCYSSPDNSSLSECDIYINRKVGGLSTVIFRVTYDESNDISVNGSTSLDTLQNNQISLEFVNSTGGQLNFVYRNIWYRT